MTTEPPAVKVRFPAGMMAEIEEGAREMGASLAGFVKCAVALQLHRGGPAAAARRFREEGEDLSRQRITEAVDAALLRHPEAKAGRAEEMDPRKWGFWEGCRPQAASSDDRRVEAAAREAMSLAENMGLPVGDLLREGVAPYRYDPRLDQTGEAGEGGE